VRPVSGSDGDTGSTYTMERALPGGNVRNGLQVFACESPTEFGIRTISGPTPFSYCYRLSTQDAETVVRLHATVAFDGAPSLMAPVLARMVRRGVDANLALLKHALERS